MISDGSGSYTYPTDAMCQWIIAPTLTTQLAVTVSQLSTESCCDFVRVFRCANITCQQLQLIGEMSGSFSAVQNTIASTSYMLVQFSSDGGMNGDGFTASWKADPVLASPVAFLSTVCHFIVKVEHIFSP